MSTAISVADTAAVSTLTRLDHLVRSSRLYPDGHTNLIHAAHAISDQFDAVLNGQDTTTIHIIGDRVLLANRLVRPAPSLRGAIRELAGFWQARGVGGVQINRNTSEADVQPFIRLLLEFSDDSKPGPDTINRELASRGIRHLQVLAPRTAVGAEDVGGEADPALAAVRLYIRGIRCAQSLIQQPITPALRTEMLYIASAVVELYQSAPLQALALVRPKELVPHPLTHPLHTAVYAVAAGQGLGFPTEALEELVQCALGMASGLHPGSGEEEDEDDPRERPGRVGNLAASLDPMGVTEGLDHARSVRHLLADGTLDPTARRVLQTTFEHDMGQDRSGPPDTLRWERQHPYTSVLGAAAELNALCTGHSSGRKHDPAGALQQMRMEDERFDADVLTSLERLLPDIEVISAYV